MQYIIKTDLSNDTGENETGIKTALKAMKLFIYNLPNSGCCLRVASCHFQVLMP